MRSMLADHPYWLVTTMAGDLARRLLTLTPVTLVPSTSFHQLVRSLNLSCARHTFNRRSSMLQLGESATACRSSS